MLSIDEPGGAIRRTVTWVRTTIAWACDRSPTSPRTTARSTLPAAKTFAASRAVPVSMTLYRTEAPSDASWLATVDIALAASPSIEPTASVSVTGRVYQRYASRPAPVTTMMMPMSDTTRSQSGEVMKNAPNAEKSSLALSVKSIEKAIPFIDTGQPYRGTFQGRAQQDRPIAAMPQAHCAMAHRKSSSGRKTAG